MKYKLSFDYSFDRIVGYDIKKRYILGKWTNLFLVSLFLLCVGIFCYVGATKLVDKTGIIVLSSSGLFFIIIGAIHTCFLYSEEARELYLYSYVKAEDIYEQKNGEKVIKNWEKELG